MTNQFFEAGIQIVERLKTLDDLGLKKVEFVRSLLDVRDSKQTTPAAYVVYQGHQIIDTVGRGERAKISQKYAIVLAVSNASSQTQVLEMIGDASEMIPKLFKAFAGWQPTTAHSPLKPSGRDVPWLDTAFSYYPFTFETIFTL